MSNSDEVARRFAARRTEADQRERRRADVRALMVGVMAKGRCVGNQDLEKLAAHLGVTRIGTTRLATRGRLVRGEGGLEIDLSDRLADFEKREVLAHEIAHVVLGERPEDIGYREWEALCDVGGDEALLPTSQLEAVDPVRPSLLSIVVLSERSGVPLNYVVRRLGAAGRLAGRRVINLLLEGGDFELRLEWPAGSDALDSDVQLPGEFIGACRLLRPSEELEERVLQVELEGRRGSFRAAARCFAPSRVLVLLS